MLKRIAAIAVLIIYIVLVIWAVRASLPDKNEYLEKYGTEETAEFFSAFL